MQFKLGQKIIDELRGKKLNLVEHKLNLVEHKLNVVEDRLNCLNTDLSNFIKSISMQNQLMFWYDKAQTQESLKEHKIKFFKSIPASQGKLRTLQLAENILLKNFGQICAENNIPYWLQAGTLLGAVRHNGWIPWDDDMDCGMLEEDLRKLKKILKTSSDFRIDDYYHFTKGYVGRFTRFKFKNDKINCFLDIPVYECCNGNSLDEIWEEIIQHRRVFEENIDKIRIKLKKNYQNEIITDKEDLKIVEEFYKNEIDKVHQSNGKYVYWAPYSVPAQWKRIFLKSMFFPLAKMPFEGVEYSVPNKYEEYLKIQYGDIYKLPMDIFPKHTDYFNLLENYEEIEKIVANNNERNTAQQTIGYTAGAFDLFHIGHLNLLKRAKENCDYLIVGVTTDELVEHTKGKRPFIPLNERIEIVKSLKYVDEVVIQNDLDKVKAYEKYHYSVLFSGDDWKNNPRWLGYEEELKKRNVPILYFPYTKNVSSTSIIKNLDDMTKKEIKAEVL